MLSVIPVQTGIQNSTTKNDILNMVYKIYYTYILASQRNGTLYIGVTSDLKKRVYQHKEGLVDSFTKKYMINLLVYFECFNDVNLAIQKEKQLKKWNREWKIRLIEEKNKNWNDLYLELNNS